ncbi:hypothetical protein [Ruania rhizosphaerae]|uniref:hypothetical protein n=1 Tax=Ruania rhizosphaerae TaxID=1840413 RepID=UPI0013571B51|nr:hypothetical protein [Ruania rhizosphaerae]
MAEHTITTRIPIALADVLAERGRQDQKWGEQNHPDGTGAATITLYSTDPNLDFRTAAELATIFTRKTDENAMNGKVTWRDILLEEVFEALAEADPAALRTELVQIAAVATQWVQAIDRRTTSPDGGGDRG